MPNVPPRQPRLVPQVMLSSTFTDLKEHRGALIDAIHRHKLHANVMENDSAKLVDVIESSLTMVHDSAAYIGVIGFKYGQIPQCPHRNAEELSVTELEFNEALRLNRSILLFIMGEDHPVKKADIEKDPAKEAQLDRFRERAKRMSSEASVHRVYATFNSLDDFKKQIGSSLAELSAHLERGLFGNLDENTSVAAAAQPIPKPPTFYAEPAYIGSHTFVGRDSQLQELSDWAMPADPTNLLIYDAIGGTGKSMLTWEWATNHAPKIRIGKDAWAGRIWYSFYEKGAIMADFCRRALAYMTGQPLEELAKRKTSELTKELLAQLHAKPWLLILDGLERVLVAYNRIDAAEIPDEEADAPTDKIVNRDPCDAIREEDNDLLRALTAALPSKVLVSSRLTPRVLLNPSDQPITGAKRITLSGLRPPDAEKLLRSCGIEGDSVSIQNFLAANCDSHPLVIGVLGGLIKNYLPARGNFDSWVSDPEGGAKLNLARLNLIQRRNHILRAALDGLSHASRQLLFTLALLSESVDYDTLNALNPHLPMGSENLHGPLSSGNERHGEVRFPAKERANQQKQRATQPVSPGEDLTSGVASVEDREVSKQLSSTVADLEQRGLLQYDSRTQRHDLHPVVRGVAVGRMNETDKERYGLRVIDYFSSLPHSPYEQAETLEDLRPGLNIVRTLLRLGQFQHAANALQGDLAQAILFQVEAYAEALSLLRPFFASGWGEIPNGVSRVSTGDLANDAAIALDFCGQSRDALAASSVALRAVLETEAWTDISALLGNVSLNLRRQNSLAKALRIDTLGLQFAAVRGDRQALFLKRLDLFSDQSRLGQWAEAEATWALLDPMGRDWSRAVYRAGDAERRHAQFHYWKESLKEEHLATAEQQAVGSKNRPILRYLLEIRGAWRLQRREWTLAVASFAEAVRMARESGFPDAASETGLALAKIHLGELVEPHREAERLAQLRDPADRLLARLWLVIGDEEQAEFHAFAAYKRAWADGEPYVNRYELTKTTELLQQMKLRIPTLPPYDPAADELFPWESEVHDVIERFRAKSNRK